MTRVESQTHAYTLDPARPVLLRPDGAVQVGWDPGRAVLVQPPRGLTATGLAAVLRTMQTPATAAELRLEAARHGTVDTAELDNLLSALVGAGVAVRD
ncbi:MAG: cyclodehydratase, partial [Mycolicibacter algericus]